MFSDLEFIKTILNGLRSRIEKVENWVVSFMRTNRPNWAQNDPDALDYIKNRPFYEEVKFITEGDITDDNSILPEGKYKLGKIYIVEVAGVQHQLEFMSAITGEGRYFVGFNIRGTRYGPAAIDSTKPFLFYVISLASPADGLYSLRVENTTKPAHVRVLQLDIHKIDGKYLHLPTPTADTAGVIKADAAETTDIRPIRLGSDGKLYASSEIPIFTTSGTGSIYKANVPGITEPVKGMLVVMIPHTNSNTNLPSLIINGGNKVTIFRPRSSGGVTGWDDRSKLISGTPYLLIYAGNLWLSINSVKPDGIDLLNFVVPDSGGTGLTSLTKGSYLVGNDRSSVLLKTPAEVLADIGATPAPATAEVGQAIVVKTVDENGKPTEWEAVDPMVVGSSTTGSTKKFKITVDDGGTITATEVTA